MRRAHAIAHRPTVQIVTELASAIALGILIGWNLLFAVRLIGPAQLGDFGRFYQTAAAWQAGADPYWLDVSHTVARAWNGHANVNPPLAMFLVLPLTAFSPPAALAWWAAISVLCLATSTVIIKRELGLRRTLRQIRTLVLLLFAFVGTTAVLATGQSSWILMLPMTLAWKWARRGRWIAAGTVLGVCMSLKPFLLIFVPYFLLQRRWGSVAASIGTAAVCFAVGLFTFGLGVHASWIQTLSSVEWGHQLNASLLGILSRAFAASPDYATVSQFRPTSVQALWLGGSAGIGVLTLITIMRRRNDRQSIDHAFVSLLFAALLISPLGWVYYLWFALGPMVARYEAWRHEAGSGVRMAFWVASIGFMWPMGTAIVGQPNSMATVTVGSVYFWALALSWLTALVQAPIPEELCPLDVQPAGPVLVQISG